MLYLTEMGYELPEGGYSEEEILANDETYDQEKTLQGAKNLADIIFWGENARENLPKAEWGTGINKINKIKTDIADVRLGLVRAPSTRTRVVRKSGCRINLTTGYCNKGYDSDDQYCTLNEVSGKCKKIKGSGAPKAPARGFAKTLAAKKAPSAVKATGATRAPAKAPAKGAVRVTIAKPPAKAPVKITKAKVSAKPRFDVSGLEAIMDNYGNLFLTKGDIILDPAFQKYLKSIGFIKVNTYYVYSDGIQMTKNGEAIVEELWMGSPKAVKKLDQLGNYYGNDVKVEPITEGEDYLVYLDYPSPGSKKSPAKKSPARKSPSAAKPLFNIDDLEAIEDAEGNQFLTSGDIRDDPAFQNYLSSIGFTPVTVYYSHPDGSFISEENDDGEEVTLSHQLWMGSPEAAKIFGNQQGNYYGKYARVEAIMPGETYQIYVD